MSSAHWVSYCKSPVKGDYLVQACLSGALFPCKGSEEAYYKVGGGGGDNRGLMVFQFQKLCFLMS